MSSLLEAAAAIGLYAAVMAMTVASLASATRLQASCIELGDELFEARQLEHLVDRAALAAGSGPAHPPAVSSLTADTVAFAADLNGNGVVEATGSETTALEVRQDGTTARVRVRFGKQTMTVLEEEHAKATLAATDGSGGAGSAASARVIELLVTPSKGGAARRLAWVLPARALP